jgi:hypothetical protein
MSSPEEIPKDDPELPHPVIITGDPNQVWAGMREYGWGGFTIVVELPGKPADEEESTGE